MFKDQYYETKTILKDVSKKLVAHIEERSWRTDNEHKIAGQLTM